MPGRATKPLFVVTVAGDRDEVAATLASVPGVRVVRALDETRLVVAARPPSDATTLAQLPGVLAVQSDRLEQPTRAVRRP